MLDSGAYVRLSENRYAGLEQDLDEKNDFYRVSTLSQNYFFGSDYHMYNALNDKLYSLNSYYSLQNKDLGNFSTLMQNTQYESNIPLGQVSDRTILNDFFGVRYLFVRINQPNADKIPAGFVLDKTTRRITDPNGNSKLDSQTQRYKNECAFPLVYWQDKVLTQKTLKTSAFPQKKGRLPMVFTCRRKTLRVLVMPIFQTNLSTFRIRLFQVAATWFLLWILKKRQKRDVSNHFAKS